MHGDTRPAVTATPLQTFVINPVFGSLLLLLLWATAGLTQPQEPRDEGLMITALVVDEEAEIPLPGANVLLFAHGDLDAWQEEVNGKNGRHAVPVPTDRALRGTSTNENGRFVFPALESGAYDLMIRMVGYETIAVNNVELSPANPRMALDDIGLSPSTYKLEEAVVTAEGTDVMLAPDRKIYRVSSSVADAGGSVSDALEEVPSVTVDLEGNVSLRGNDNVRILIDGKPSSRVGISGGEALQQLPAELVDRIEVMTNPSAKYDAQGDAGIVNIVLKKERRRGVNGSVNLSGSYPLGAGIGSNLNYRAGKLNWFANHQLRYRESNGGGSTDQEYFAADAPYRSLDQDTDMDRAGWENYIRFGVEYLIDDRNTLTVSAFNEYGETSMDSDVNYRYYDDTGNLAAHFMRMDPEDETERFSGADIGYRHSWDDRKGHELTVDYQLETGSENELSEITETVMVGSGSESVEYVDNLEGETRHLVQVDYVQPFNQDHKLEAGLKGNLRALDHEYTVREAGSGATLDVSDKLIYDENIYAAYLTYSNRLTQALSYQLGLRGELSDITTEFEAANSVNERDYFDLFPSTFVTWEFNPVNSIQASWSRRLQRPHHWYLIPFWSYTDSRNRRSGNPNLDPEYSHSFEIGHLWHTEKGSVNSSVYYRMATGVIEWVETTEVSGGEQWIVSTPYNIGDRDSYGFEFVVIRQFFPWMNVQGSFNVFQSVSEGEFQGIVYDREDISWFTRASTRLSFSKTTQAQLRLFYRGPRETIQGTRKAMASLDLGLSKSLYDNAFTLSFNVRDLLDTRKRVWETTTETFYSDSEFQWRGRTFSLQLTWRFNQDQRDRRGEPGPGEMNGGFDDEGGF